MDKPLITFGMLGTGSWCDFDPVTRTYLNEPGKMRPETWDERIFWAYPNGDTTMMAILSRLPKKPCDSPYVHYQTFTVPSMAGNVTGVFTDAAMVTPYIGGGMKGQTFYLALDEEAASQIRNTATVKLFHNPTIPGSPPDWELEVYAEVLEVVVNGANSFARITLMKNDVPTPSGHNMRHAARLLVIGDVNPEASTWPENFIYHPKNEVNLTQIFLESVPVSGTQLATSIRGLDPKTWARTHALLAHQRKKERTIIFGELSDGIGTNGMPKRTMSGILEMGRKANAIISDFRSAVNTGITYANGAGSWIKSGEAWLLAQFERLIQYSGQEMKPTTDWLCLCGSMWHLQLNLLLKDTKMYTLTENAAAYGIRVSTWHSPFGDNFHFVTYPNFSQEPALRTSCLILDPASLVYCPLKGRDTQYISDDEKVVNKKSVGHTWMDGMTSGYLAEFTLEYHNAYRMAWLHGAGYDRP